MAIILFFTALTLKNPAFIDDTLEMFLLDLRFEIRNLTSPQEVPEEIVIVAIDEKSLAKHGRWPWPGNVQAELIGKIFEQKPAVVALEMPYSDEELLDADSLLAGVIRKYGEKLVVALDFEVEEGLTFEADIDDLLYGHAIKNISNPGRMRSVEAFRVELPSPLITGSAKFGHVSNIPDRDGKLRRENLYIKYGDEYFPSLALQTASVAEGKGISIIAGENVELDGLLIPTDTIGRFKLDYFGKAAAFTYLSAADILSGDLPSGFIRQRILLIGTTAAGTYEPHVTMFSENMPGVEKNATVVANIINRDFLKSAPQGLDLFVVLLSGALALMIALLKKRSNIISYLCLLVLMLLLNQTVFNLFGMQVNLIYPLLTLLSIGFFQDIYRYSVEEKGSREMRKIFSGYLPENVIEKLLKHPDLAGIEGVRRNVTVLFADLRGFAAFAEGHDPKEAAAILNEYLTAMTDIVFKWDGAVERFEGDTLVAFWGAPLCRQDHSEHAVRCALNMVKRFDEIKSELGPEGMFSIGIGLNTGEVLAGCTGAVGTKMNYTIIGEHVIIAERVKALTKQFEANVLFSEAVFYNIKELIEQGRIGHVSIKGISNLPVRGRERPIMICAIKSLKHDAESIIAGVEDNDD